MRKKHVLTVWNNFKKKKNTPRKIVTRTLCTLSPVCSLLQWLVTVGRGAGKIGFMQWSLILRLPLIEKKAALWYNGQKSCFRLLFPDLPWYPLSNHHVCFTTHNFVNWNNFKTVLVQVGKTMLYRSRKNSPAGKNGFVIKVQHVLLTLSPYTSLKKIITTVYKKRLNQIFHIFSFLTYAR